MELLEILPLVISLRQICNLCKGNFLYSGKQRHRIFVIAVPSFRMVSITNEQLEPRVWTFVWTYVICVWQRILHNKNASMLIDARFCLEDLTWSNLGKWFHKKSMTINLLFLLISSYKLKELKENRRCNFFPEHFVCIIFHYLCFILLFFHITSSEC